jgi:TatD DNase family protein
MILTDTHTHQYYQDDAERLTASMQRCFDNKVERLFLPNVDADSVKQVFALTDAYPQNCFPMLGLHPCNVKEDWEQEISRIKEAGKGRKVYAVGEIGIDLYWDKTTLPQQIEAFHWQINWAKSENLPVVIHCREAFDEVFEVLDDAFDDQLFGIFHCFTGNLEQAKRAIGLGFHLGIGGVVTYKNGGLDKFLKQIDLSHIVLETDSPYLAPVPYRGKPNESSYLVYVAQKVADIYQQDIETIAKITTENSKKIFGI